MASRVLVIVLVLLGVVAGLFTFLRQRSGGDGQFHPDHSFVDITDANAIELRDADGTLLRVMREDLTVSKTDPTHVTVTPDGHYAYHDATVTKCGDLTLRAIARVDLVRGYSELAAIGHSPAMSPDGRHLAYVTPAAEDGERFATLVGERPDCRDAELLGRDEVVVVRDLSSATDQSWETEGADELRWLDDNRQLAIDGRVLDTTQNDVDVDALEEQPQQVRAFTEWIERHPEGDRAMETTSDGLVVRLLDPERTLYRNTDVVAAAWLVNR